jgi:quercetin dioxygenase-like cupin family protein
MSNYTLIENLADLAPDVPADSILSHTFLKEENTRAILFSFAPGQELSEHTASMPAVLHFIQGEAQLTLGSDQFEAKPGTWVHMPAQLSHSIVAKTPVSMLLYLLGEG